MKPWIKICLVFSLAYAVASTAAYILSAEKSAVWGIILIGIIPNLAVFLIYRKRPERIPTKGEIVRIKSPFQELCEQIKKLTGVQK